MDRYEDMQRFREKTSMKSIRFVDFTKQNKEVNHGQWTIVQQLAGNNAPLVNNISSDPSSQILNTSVASKVPDPVYSAPLTTGVNSTASTMSLLKDVDMQLNRPESFQTEVQSLSPIMADIQSQLQPQPAAQAQPQLQPQPAAQAQPQFQPQPAAQAQPQFQPQPAAQAQYRPPAAESQANFSHLFAAPVGDTPVVEKEASLQSLLKRIATCR